MREDYLEQLDKMFPDGYVICYTNPDNNLRMSLYNPHRYELVGQIHDMLKDFAIENGEDGKCYERK